MASCAYPDLLPARHTSFLPNTLNAASLAFLIGLGIGIGHALSRHPAIRARASR